ncbi:MAG: hypothetical protein GF329_05840 [Candidatus Lokiarchaeota archaeon]|nr:hypothetical protein [Candidatus Lokiarchaeota archaeon]
MPIGALGFVYFTERELNLKRHYLFYITLFLMICLIFVIIFSIVNKDIFIYSGWIPFLILLLTYIIRASIKIKEYRVNILGFFLGILIAAIGCLLIADFMVDILNLYARLLGDCLIITGICLVSLFFLGLPTSLKEIDWKQKLETLLLMHESGECICVYDFKKHPKYQFFQNPDIKPQKIFWLDH